MKILFNTFENKQSKSTCNGSLKTNIIGIYEKNKSIWMRIYYFIIKESNFIPEIVNRYLFSKAFLILKDLKKVSKLKEISFHDVYLNVFYF